MWCTMWKGAAFIIASSVFFAVLALAARLAGQHFPTSEVIFIRAFVNFLVCVLVVGIAGVPLIQKKWNGGLILRSLAGFGSLSFYFLSLQKLKLADAVVLNSSSPLFIALYQTLFQRKKPSLSTLFLVVLALFGVGLILKPELGFFNTSGFFGLLAAAFAGLAFMALHGISRSYEPVVIVGSFTGISTLLILPWAGEFRMPTGYSEWMLFLTVGLSASIAQAAMTRGYRHLKAITAAQLGNFTVVFSAVLGAVALREFPAWNFYLGSFLVVASCGFLLRGEISQN